MKLRSDSFPDGGRIPGEFAFAVIDPAGRPALSRNRNPHLAWSDVRAGVKSFVLLCHDPDVPSRADDVNQEGREVPASLPRVDFFHWILLDIPAGLREIAAGSHSDGVTTRGKPGPDAPGGLRHGINDYTQWFAGDPAMKGEYFGYDGPAPPWNDSLLHHYLFRLSALDVERLEVRGRITGPSVRPAMEGHILEEASWTGNYSLNPRIA